MAADDIRIAWNPGTGQLCALHPDDGTYGPGVVTFRFAEPADLPAGMNRHGLLIGPTLREVIAKMEEQARPAEPGR